MSGGINGKIFTFYSYKGGTGRSMLLANVAWLLASVGRKVLAIDWDLEAPGLHRYFYPFLEDKELTWSDGLMNFVDDYKAMAMTPPAEEEDLPDDWYVQHADIRQYAVSLQWQFANGGRLDFVPAGKQDETYSSLVNGFNWEDFYKRLGGSRFLDAAACLMRRDYHYILIDSRTGVSDTSGICTVRMPDALVICFTLNYQSINGAAAVADYVYDQRVGSAQGSAEARSAPNAEQRFNIFPVPTRLEDAQTRKLERRREYARLKKFARYPLYLHQGTRPDYWSSVSIRYHSFYAYEELLAAFGEKEKDINSLLSSVQRLTAYLVASPSEISIDLPQPKRDEILREFAGETFESVAPAKPEQAIDDVIAHLPLDQQETARSVLLRLVRVAGPEEAEHTRQLVPLKEFESDPASLAMVHTLRSYQVLSIDTDSPTGSEVVQLVPGIALNDWQRLTGWIDADRDFLIWRQGIRSLAEMWDRERQQDPGARDIGAAVRREDSTRLLRGAALAVAVTWRRRRGDELSPVQHAFIESSLAAESREREARAASEREAYERRRAAQLQNERRQRTASDRKRWLDVSGLVARLITPRPPALAMPHHSPETKMAMEALRGRQLGSSELLALAKTLKASQNFTLARRILTRAQAELRLDTDKKLRRRIFQEWALCTYKDPDLPADRRLDLALDILRRGDDLATTADQETLGLAGAIHKRMWEIDSQKEHLERSLDYYLHGYQQDPVNDQGYTGINAAFVLDLLAQLERDDTKQPTNPVHSEPRRAQARQIRENIVLRVAPLVDRPGNEWLAGAWWFYSTVAEALFGLGRFEEATNWLDRGVAAVGTVPDWEYQSTLRQFTRLALLQTGELSIEELEHREAWRALSGFFKTHAIAVRGAFIGKVGLALSGGGFRAALYHIGVLAKLAELDVLRHVEVLSCVSGGSVVGAHYYLEVRQVLQSKEDGEITRDDYVEIVKRIEKDFVAGVQKNIRTRVAAEFVTNLQLIFRAGYSRTLRVGELYEREIYSRVRDGEGDRPRWLGALNIVPLGEPETFAPKLHNWRRLSKAPILILNATTLNTGHNWQFTTSWMGEPPSRIDTDTDGNEQLRRMYYWEAPEAHRQIRLGHATAASSCVPGIFEPLSLDELYPDRVVRLVDGGVCDNQGVSGLLEQDCTVMLVSDGSGQTESQCNPSTGLLGVPLRSNAILQARVRDAQIQELRARRRAALLRGLMFVHLKEDLDVDPVDWVECPDPYQASDDARPPSRRGALTRYGIAKEVQALLAGIRTDLDSFTDVEANALMSSAYRMTEHEFQHSPNLRGFPEPPAPLPWDFLAVEQGMKNRNRKYKFLMKMLGVSGALSFKVWRLSRVLTGLALALGAALAAALVWAGFTYRNVVVVPEIAAGEIFMYIATAAATAIAAYVLGNTIMGLVQWRETLSRVGLGVGMSLLGWIAARLHLHVFDRIFLRMGSIEAFERREDQPG